MLKRLTLLLLSAVALQGAELAPGSQPVFVVLYARFFDHSHPFPNNDRMMYLLPLLEKLRAKYPNSGISSLLEFSGSMSQVFLENNPAQHVVDKVKEASRQGLINIGYTGEDEPSYLYRPKPDLLSADTPEKRWLAEADAAEHFLVDFKDPVTGRPVSGLSGGLKRMQDVFGAADFIRGVTQLMGGDSAVTNQVRKLNAKAMMVGLPPSDTRRGIESYGTSAMGLAKGVSPVPKTSPEVFWEDNALRLSDLSLPDNKPHTTDEPIDALQKVFRQFDRTHVRVIALELDSYTRYLVKRSDGSVRYDPMEWLYYHPDTPDFPPTMKPFLPPRDVVAGNRNEEAVLNWLLQDYFPSNPGSRFLSIRDLQQMAGSELPSTVAWSEIKAAAADADAQFKEHPARTSDYLRAGDRFFSNAEAFGLMVESLAAIEKSGSPPASLTPAQMFGPIAVPNDMGPVKGSVTVRQVLQAAALLAPSLRNTAWKPIPDNVVPAYVQVGALKVNSAQFLRLMASACLDPSPEKVLTLSPIEAHSELMFRYPRSTPVTDQGMGWTLKPATLQFASPGAAAGGR